MFVEKKKKFLMGLMVIKVDCMKIFPLKSKTIQKYPLFIFLLHFLFKSVYTKIQKITAEKQT
jgi:hypothetical protein